jgi:hypothetical protein
MLFILEVEFAINLEPKADDDDDDDNTAVLYLLAYSTAKQPITERAERTNTNNNKQGACERTKTKQTNQYVKLFVNTP